MFRRALPAIALLIAAACTAQGVSTPADCDVPPPSVRFGGGLALDVDLASTDETRARGLMGVTDLPSDQGMAFLFDAPSAGTFWMKDTVIPLSIAFVDEDGRIVTIHEMAPCAAEPCREYAAASPFTMAIEANAGWFAEHGIRVGHRVRLRQMACL